MLPIVANIWINLGSTYCVFSWTNASRFYARGDFLDADSDDAMESRIEEDERTMGHDCRIDEIDPDNGGSAVLEQVGIAYEAARIQGLTFHQEQRDSMVWLYEDFLPMQLAKLPAVSIAIPSGRRAALMPSDASSNFDLGMLFVTWNVGASEPSTESGEDKSLAGLLREAGGKADIICIGLQETCELNARNLMQDNKSWEAWMRWSQSGIKEVYADTFTIVATANLVGMLLLIFVKSNLIDSVADVRTCVVPCGVGGVGGNKGGVSARFDFGPCSMCFINSHLAAGQEHYIDRCADFRTIMNGLRFERNVQSTAGDGGDTESVVVNRRASGSKAATFTSPTSHEPLMSSTPEASNTFAGSGDAPLKNDSKHVIDHNHIFWIGDTNSRLHWPGHVGGIPIELAREKVRDLKIGEMLTMDQLSLSRRDGFAFDGFDEHRIQFLPSYKWRPGGDELDIRTQKHVPAWTDRFLWKSVVKPVPKVSRYDMYLGLKQSDHRPVFACVDLTIRGFSPNGVNEKAPAPAEA